MIDVNVNVRVDFPALDKIATLMCVKSEEISSALSRIPDVITPQPVEEPAMEAPAEEAPAEKPKRTRKKTEKPVQEAPETPVQPEEPKAEEVVEPVEEPAAEPAETPVETAEEAPAKDYTLAQLSAACMRLRDRNPDALEQARALFGKYGVTGLAGLKGDQDKLNGFASDLIALGAEL